MRLSMDYHSNEWLTTLAWRVDRRRSGSIDTNVGVGSTVNGLICRGLTSTQDEHQSDKGVSSFLSELLKYIISGKSFVVGNVLSYESCGSVDSWIKGNRIMSHMIDIITPELESSPLMLTTMEQFDPVAPSSQHDRSDHLSGEIDVLRQELSELDDMIHILRHRCLWDSKTSHSVVAAERPTLNIEKPQRRRESVEVAVVSSSGSETLENTVDEPTSTKHIDRPRRYSGRSAHSLRFKERRKRTQKFMPIVSSYGPIIIELSHELE